MKKLYSLIASILGFIIILLYAFENSQELFQFEFSEMDVVMGYFALAQRYLVYALAGLTGLELVSGKKLIGFLFYLILAFVVVTTFFGSVVDSIMAI